MPLAPDDGTPASRGVKVEPAGWTEDGTEVRGEVRVKREVMEEGEEEAATEDDFPHVSRQRA